MDGYAVRAADCASGRSAPAGGAAHPGGQRAGSRSRRGTAARIFTGAPIPPGADAVVMQEQLRAGRRRGHRQASRRSRANGCAVRARTSARAAKSLPPGISCGRRTPASPPRSASRRCRCIAACKVALFLTGDELVMPGEPLPPGRDLQLQPLHAQPACCRCSAARSATYGIVPDTLRGDARGAARGGRRQRPHRHLGRRVGGRGGPRQARGRGRGAARAVEDRDQAGQAARVRRGAARAEREAHFIGLPGQPGVELRHLPAVRAAVHPALPGRRPGGAAALSPLRADFDWTEARCAARIPARKIERRRRARSVSEPELGAC